MNEAAETSGKRFSDFLDQQCKPDLLERVASRYGLDEAEYKRRLWGELVLRARRHGDTPENDPMFAAMLAYGERMGHKIQPEIDSEDWRRKLDRTGVFMSPRAGEGTVPRK